jgi:4'-phosphopantetheinyl transferase
MTPLPNWPAPAQCNAPLALPIDRVDCWAISLSALPTDFEGMLHSLLSADEIKCAERFRIGRLRTRYIGRHAALRLLIARYLQASPVALLIVQEINGRPVLANPAGRLHFNLSHSRDVVLMAVSCIAPLGVDVEEVRNVPDFAEIARYHFAPAEFEDIQGFTPDKRLSAFFVTWTRKEAFVKALGVGLSHPLDSFCTGRPDGPPQLRIAGTPAMDWTLADVAPSDEYAGALAIRHPKVSLNCRRADWPFLLDPDQRPTDR